nr:hypothetical protein [Tanacetum cinerariifolium]
METMFCISNCTVENQIKSTTCTLLGSDLTWWNSQVRNVGHDVAYAMTWTNLKKRMTDKYCPRARLRSWRMFPEESNKIEKYISGLLDMIHGSVMASKPKTMQDAIEFATKLIDKKIRTLAEHQAENKRKLNNINQAQQQPPKKQVWPYFIPLGLVKGRSMLGLYRCATSASFITMASALNPTWYECGNQGHYKSDCSKLKNQNHGNQVGGTGARGMVHALGGAETNQDLNDMEDDINA